MYVNINGYRHNVLHCDISGYYLAEHFTDNGDENNLFLTNTFKRNDVYFKFVLDQNNKVFLVQYHPEYKNLILQPIGYYLGEICNDVDLPIPEGYEEYSILPPK